MNNLIHLEIFLSILALIVLARIWLVSWVDTHYPRVNVKPSPKSCGLRRRRLSVEAVDGFIVETWEIGRLAEDRKEC